MHGAGSKETKRLSWISRNLCGVRYRKGENVVCFSGKEETLAHLEKLSSYEDRLPSEHSLWFDFSCDFHMKTGCHRENSCGLTFHLILIWRQVEPQRTLLTSVSGDTFLSTATTTVGCSTTSLTMGNSSTIPRLQMLAQVMVCFTQVFMNRLTMTMTVTVVVAVKGFVLILRAKYNTGSEPFSTFAVRDIEKGEEVTNITQVSTYLQNMCIL